MNGSTTEERTGTLTTSEQHRGIDWLDRHPGSLTEYLGEWVALDENGVVAHSPSAIEVVRLAKESGVNDPLLVPVMEPRFGIDV
jgi:hypothetical protein